MNNISIKQITQTPNKINFKGAQTSINKGVNELLAKDFKQEQPFFIKANKNFLSNLLFRINKNKNSSFVIGMAGESASGKTTITKSALEAAKRNNKSLTVLNGDDYFNDVSKERIRAGGFEQLLATGYSYDKPEAVNLPLLKTHLLTLKNGIEVKSPTYDFTTSGSIPNSKLKKPSRIIVHEGLYNLRDEFDDVSDAKVFVKSPFDVMKTRWYERTAQRNTTGHAADVQFKDVTSKAKEYIYPQENRADFVLNGLSDIEYQKEVINRLIDITS